MRTLVPRVPLMYATRTVRRLRALGLKARIRRGDLYTGHDLYVVELRSRSTPFVAMEAWPAKLNRRNRSDDQLAKTERRARYYASLGYETRVLLYNIDRVLYIAGDPKFNVYKNVLATFPPGADKPVLPKWRTARQEAHSGTASS